jgi:hypothetical protein
MSRQKSWFKNATLVYWINAYNAHNGKNLDNYPTKKASRTLMSLVKNFPGKKKYSLEEIEHEILRKMDEPRIYCHQLCFFSVQLTKMKLIL